jgi:aminoglycoside phosphotransferase (APT) family kinase protein
MIPTTIDQVTAEWVRHATGLAVTDIEYEIIGVGLGVSSSVYRLRLQGENVPETLVLKLQALDEAAVFTSSMLHMYEREVHFFDELATRSPIRVPKGYGAAVSDDGTHYYLFMEDMGGHRAVDQNLGMDLADAERAVDALAGWHAEFWGDAERYVESRAALSIGDDIYHGVLPLVFGEGWAKVQAEMEVHPTVAEVAPRWTEKLPDMLTALSTSPTTVLHGDYRADNIFFDDNNEVVLLDFQITGLGTPAYDLAYFITQSLLPDVAAANERTLFDRYIANVVAAGVPVEETERLWEDYRVAALFCLVYPIVASRGMDLSDPRQYALVDTMNVGCARAIDDLSLRDLL